MKTIGIIKDWQWPDLNRQTPGGDGDWETIRFVDGEHRECDVLLVLNNNLRRPYTARVRRGNVWALMQEPYIRGMTDWVVEKHAPFDKVFSHCRITSGEKYTRCHPAIPWHLNATYQELVRFDVPKKPHDISWVVGNVSDLPGHLLRRRFLKRIRQDPSAGIDLYGRAVRPIPFKNEAIVPYRYSLAIENTCSPDYWTEKLADCFLAWTVPIYYGCPNLEDYFQPDSFIRIDIRNPEQALREIRRIVANDDWHARISAIAEARYRVLDQYQLYPLVQRLVQTHAINHEAWREVTIHPYRRSIKSYAWRRWYKFKHSFQPFA